MIDKLTKTTKQNKKKKKEKKMYFDNDCLLIKLLGFYLIQIDFKRFVTTLIKNLPSIYTTNLFFS